MASQYSAPLNLGTEGWSASTDWWTWCAESPPNDCTRFMPFTGRRGFTAATATTRVYEWCWVGPADAAGARAGNHVPLDRAGIGAGGQVRASTRLCVKERLAAGREILHVEVHAIDVAEAVRQSERLILNRGKGYVC